MPRIPFTDLASSPEFKAMPPEDQQVVATGYWDEVATERPDQAEFYKGIRDVSKSLLDAKTKRADASPVQRRFLDAQVQDLAFDLSLGDEFAQGRLTQEGYTEALKVRDTESAQRQAPLDKTRNLFSDDPAKQKALAIRLDGLEQTAITGGVFGSSPMKNFGDLATDVLTFNIDPDDGMVSSSRDAYAALKEQTAKDYGMEPDEVEDLVKHRLGFQEKPVSRDAVGNPFIKPEIMAQGPDAVKQAILNSDLPWREKQRMTAEGDLKERMDGYYKSTMEGVKKNHPELAKRTGVDQIEDPRNGFELLMSDLNKTGYRKFASGFTGYVFGAGEQIAPALADPRGQIRAEAFIEGRDSNQAVEEAQNKARESMTFERRAQESVNQLSREFYKNQGTLWGVDASAYGSGAGSVLTAVGLGVATGGLALPVTSARVATMGPSALRMLNGANSVMRASPSIGLAMAQTGTSTYENALKSGKSEEEAGNLATLAGATEGVITGLFSLLGVGGLESVGEQLIGTAARQAVRDTAKSGFRTFGEKMLKGVTAEQFEEGMIAAFDSATVQARINPNMTVEDFQNTLRETALVTLAVSGPTIGMGALKKTLTEKATYQQTDDEVELRADINLADATDPLRDRVRREGGVGTPLGERLRLTRPGARGTVPLEGTIPSDVVTDVNGVPASETAAAEPIAAPGGRVPRTLGTGQSVGTPLGERLRAGRTAPPSRSTGLSEADQIAIIQKMADLPNWLQPAMPDERKAETAQDMEALMGYPAGSLEFVRAGNSTVFRDKQSGDFVKLAYAPSDEKVDDISRQIDFLKANAPNLASLPTMTRVMEGIYTLRQPPAGIEGASIYESLTKGDKALFKTLQDQNPLSNDSGNGVLRVETDQTLKNMGLVVGPDGNVRALAFDFDGVDADMMAKSSEAALAILKAAPEMAGVPLSSFSPEAQKRILDSPTDATPPIGSEPAVGELPTGETAPAQTYAPAAEVIYKAENGDRLPAKVVGVNLDGTYTVNVPGGGVVTYVPRNRLEPTTPTTDETKVPNQVEKASGLPPVEGQPVVPSPAVQAQEGTAQREGQGSQEVVEEAPAEGAPAEAEPDYAEVFEVLNDRDPDTKPINTESSKFRDLVNSLKDTRVGELVGRLFQKKADVAEMQKRIKKERKERDDQRKERNRFRMKNKPLDVHQKKIKELTGHGHGFTRGIKDFLVAGGLDPNIKFNEDWRAVALNERNALGGANSKKTLRIRAQFDKLTPEAKEVVEAFHKMGQKPAEEKASLETFFATRVGQALRQNPLRSKTYYEDRKLPVPKEYDGLSERVPPQIATAIFKNSDTSSTPDQVAGTLDMIPAEFWNEFWAAVNGQTDRVDQTLEDYNERKLREAEDREIAFAEQQIKALENNVQTVDLRQVRDGDKFTLGGTEYTATGVEADKRGQTKSFMLFAFNPETYERGPLSGTRVSDDFFAESVTPTEGSLAHVDPAEIEAINIAQAFPEEFEDAAEPAPTATEPEVAPTAGPVPYSPEALKETFDVSDEQAVAMDALVQAMGLDTARIQLQRGGVPSDAAMRQEMGVRDAEHLAAVERGDTAKAQELVDAAARAAGLVYLGLPNAYFQKKTHPLGSLSLMEEADRLSPSEMRSLEASIRERGFTSEGGAPIVVFPNDQGTFDVEDGNHRITIAKNILKLSDDTAVPTLSFVESADPVTRDADGNVIPLSQRFNPENPSILYQKTSSTKWDREKFDSLPDQSKKNLAINIVEYGWNPAEFGMTDADVQTWAAEGLAKRAARLAEETAAEARSRAVLEKSKTAPPEASLVTEADLQESQLPDDGYFYHVTTPTGARAILKSRRIASGKRQSMADGYYAEYSRGKVFFTDRGGVSYWQGKISDHLEAQGRSGKTVTIRIPKHAVGDLKVDEPGTRDARTPAWFSPENVLFQNQQGPAKGSFEQLPETGDILLRGLSSPDVSTGVHEIAHAARRTILNRDTPAEARAGITDADIAVAEEWAGAKDGVWSRAAEEKFARGWERYLRDGKSPVAALQGVFDKMAAWLRSVYVTVAGSPIDVEISPEMRAVFDKLVSRTLPQPAAPAPAPQAATPAPQPQATTPQPQATTPPPPAEPTPAPVAELEDPDVVGMQNAATDRRRQRAGLPPRFAPVRFSNPDAWDEAMRRINKDPATGRDLVNDLRKAPRSIDPVETALYTHELLVREQALDDAYRAYNKDQNPDTETAMKEASAAVAEAILTAERIGTIEGRSFQARKILVHQDFSLARAVAKMTAANGGKELSADQTKEVAELHEQLREIQTQLAVAQEQIAKEEAQRVHVTVVAEFKKGAREAKSRGEKPGSWIDRKAEEARARILARKKSGEDRFNAGIPPEDFRDMVIVGVSYLKNGLVSITEFAVQLVKDFGRKVAPSAGDIFAKSQELYGATAPSSKVKSRENVLDDIDSDAPLNDKAIFQLVRHYINEGVDGFEPVMQAVLTDLRQFYPDLTLREVHDAYSKYGQTSVPSKEPDLKLAREYRELSRLQSQLEDAERSLVPLKTGLQREKATQRVRDLTKQVKDTMRRLNIQPTTNENQLRSAFDAIKTRLRNEYEDLDTAIRKGEERKERSPQTFTPEQEKELKDLRQKRDDRKKDYEAIFKKKGLTTEQRIERMEARLDRRIEEERKMLEEGILKRNREMLMGPFSPALKSRRETLDKLKAERRELQKAARPKTPELEKKYKRDLASLERRIAEEQKLLAEGLTARKKQGFKFGLWSPELAEMQARLDALRDGRRELAESRKPEKDEAAAAYERATKAIEASIQRYKDIIAGIAKPDAGKKYSVDAEMAALLDQRDALRDAAAALRAMDPARIDKRKQAVLEALDKSIIEISRKITDGDLSTKGRTDFFATDPDVTKLRTARDLLNKTLEAMRKDALPKRTPEEIRNSRDQKLIENKINQLRDRLARGDYAPKPKLPPPDYAGRDALIKEKKRLESEFNKKVLELALASRSFGRKVFDNTLDVVFGVSRAMLTSFDAGAFGRQAGLVNFMRPGLAIKNFPANFAFSEKAATRYETAMETDPRWARAQAADLALTSWRPGSSLTDMEEVYRSRIAKKIPGVAASERAYVTYLNQVRFTYFNKLMDTLPVAHQTEENMKFLARHVNMMTGRGKMGPKMEAAAATLASVFFSPKYWWSRLQVLGNLLYIPLDAMTGFRLGAKETKIARQIVAVEYARLGAMLGLVFGLFAFAKDAFDWDDEEFSIGTDWRSSDFGKLRIANTRIDFMAGLLQNVVFIGRMVTGEKTTGSGERVPISGNIERKFGQNRLTETIRLLRTKLSPAAGSIVNFLDEQDVVGNKFNLETEILGSYIPMSVAEFYSSTRELGIGAGSAAGLLNFIGIGAATYGGKEDFVIEEDIFTGRIMEPFGIKPGTFFIDQSRYEKEVKEKGWVIPKSKGLPTF